MLTIERHALQYPGLFDPALPAVTFYGRGTPFSNFKTCRIVLAHPITGELVEWETVEHYMQAAKATTVDDADWIRRAPTPLAAKHRGGPRGEGGRRIKLRPGWDADKFDVVLGALREKFAQPRFWTPLAATGRRYLAEHSRTDPIWGWVARDGTLTGQNLLGLGLMLVRADGRIRGTAP